MVKNKYNEFLVSNYIIHNTNLLFQNSLKDIEIKEKGKLVELYLYYLPTSKKEIFKLKREFYKETQFINCVVKNNMTCAKFLAPSKYADLIICKLHGRNATLAEKRIIEYCETKNPGRS